MSSENLSPEIGFRVKLKLLAKRGREAVRRHIHIAFKAHDRDGARKDNEFAIPKLDPYFVKQLAREAVMERIYDQSTWDQSMASQLTMCTPQYSHALDYLSTTWAKKKSIVRFRYMKLILPHLFKPLELPPANAVGNGWQDEQVSIDPHLFDTLESEFVDYTDYEESERSSDDNERVFINYCKRYFVRSFVDCTINGLPAPVKYQSQPGLDVPPVPLRWQ
ncbi:hypothetical protein V1514DRAFT_327042 [Lipomyces japonicus]|uniref:uncharacterized protein n=1 Tax=Lipomyces japonicus TaxID=56871 RepID=UPI0034CE854C